MDINTPNKEYEHGDHMIYSCLYHVIFCPKYRRSVLVDGVDVALKQIILDKQESYGYKVIEMEIMPDHVHLLISVNPKIGVYNAVTRIKGFSSKTLRCDFPWLKSRIPTLWTRSKFISTVGSVSLDVVKQYIKDQKHV